MQVETAGLRCCAPAAAYSTHDQRAHPRPQPTPSPA
jgi:hypothetical protein